jgi:hypothetical protein
VREVAGVDVRADAVGRVLSAEHEECNEVGPTMRRSSRRRRYVLDLVQRILLFFRRR